MPILIDTGPTEHGWHRAQTMKRCPYLFALKHEMKLTFPLGAALIKGIYMHVGLAHYYRRLQAKQEGKDQSKWFKPSEAILESCEKLKSEHVGKWQKAEDFDKWVKLAQEATEEYGKIYAGESFKVIAVEREIKATIESRFGTFPWTGRWDLVIMDRNRRYWLWDHKSSFQLRASSANRFTMSGQFLGMQIVGLQILKERFGGVRINMIGWEDRPFKFQRFSPKPAPYRLARWKADYCWAKYLEQEFKRQGLPPDEYPGAITEDVCTTQYGPCEATAICQWGPEAEDAIPLESFREL